MVDANRTIIETLGYTWRNAKKEHPNSNDDLYWVVILNNNTHTLEATVCNYNAHFNFWEVLEYEEVIAWMPFVDFCPKIPVYIWEIDNE